MGEEARDKAKRRIADVRAVYDRHGRLFHVAWVCAAVVVIVAGVLMMVLPGPAAVVIPLGLAMLAVVSDSARRVLLSGVDVGARLVRVWRDLGKLAKVALVAVAVAVVGAVAVWWLL